MTPPWEELFATDGERRHAFSDAVAEYEGLLQSYPANGYAVELIPQGGVEERADFLERRLGRLHAPEGAREPPRRPGAMRARIRLAEAADRAAVVGCVNAAFEGFAAQIGKHCSGLNNAEVREAS